MERKLTRSEIVRGILGPLIAIVVLIALLWPHFAEIGEAWKLISIRAAAALVGLHLIALLLRAEAWGRCIDAAGAPIERSLLHSSSSLRFLADSVVPTYIGAWVRIWLAKRYDAPRAAKPDSTPTPTIGQMFTADGLMLLVEAVITIGLIIAAVLTSSLEWWWIFVFTAAVGLLLLIVRWVFIRYKDREFAQTARVLQNSGERYKLAAILAVVLTLQPIRYYIAFKALGLNPSMSDALLAFLLTTVFNALPIGPGPSSIAASAALFADDAVAVTASAGLVLLATAIVAAAAYSIYGVFELNRRSRVASAGSADG
ncbi:MAG: flippase-like domain-containing protein [Solirubrobacterales bacterium]|nr:flippase-like domain-containing protein [Solirubrobacterales bacterium]